MFNIRGRIEILSITKGDTSSDCFFKCKLIHMYMETLSYLHKQKREPNTKGYLKRLMLTVLSQWAITPRADRSHLADYFDYYYLLLKNIAEKKSVN